MSHQPENTQMHERWLEMAAAYALDALDGSDRDEFEGHLARCAECRLAVQEYREVAGLLVHAPSPMAAPSGLQDRVAAMLAASREATETDDGSTAPPAHGDATGVVDIEQGRTRRAAPAAAPVWRSGTAWLAAASLAGAAALGIFWRDANERARLARSEVEALRQSLDRRDALLASLRGQRVQVASLTAGSGDAAVARVFWNQELHRFVVTAFDVPPAPSGRTYQLWAIAKGHDPVSMGTFNTDSSGVASVILPVGADIESLGAIELCAVTEEPAAGSPQPTETPRLTGTWRQTD